MDRAESGHGPEFCRLFHADPGAARRLGDLVLVALGGLLGAVLRVSHLWQRRLPARTVLQTHVSVRPDPKRPDRHGFDGHRLRHRAR